MSITTNQVERWGKAVKSAERFARKQDANAFTAEDLWTILANRNFEIPKPLHGALMASAHIRNTGNDTYVHTDFYDAYLNNLNAHKFPRPEPTEEADWISVDTEPAAGIEEESDQLEVDEVIEQDTDEVAIRLPGGHEMILRGHMKVLVLFFPRVSTSKQ